MTSDIIIFKSDSEKQLRSLRYSVNLSICWFAFFIVLFFWYLPVYLPSNYNIDFFSEITSYLYELNHYGFWFVIIFVAVISFPFGLGTYFLFSKMKCILTTV